MIVQRNKLSCVDSSVNIYLDLYCRQKQNGGYELEKVFAEKYYASNHCESHSDVSTDHFIRTVQTEHRTAKKGMSLNRLSLKSIRDDLR